MGMNLYVGNLDWSVTSDQLFELFRPHGKIVLAQVMTDHGSGQSRGFGFVEMAEVLEAHQAITHLNGVSFQGRRLKVHEARPRES
jgi:RNA recognition motif-containing protein